jgi:hypothetical protein
LTTNFQQWTADNAAELETFFTNIVTSFSNFGALIYEAWGNIFADLRAWWETNGKPVFDGILKAIGDVCTWVLELYNMVIAPVIDKFIASARELWENNLRPLWQNILGLVSEIGECLLAFWNGVLKPVVDWIITYIGPPICEIIKFIVGVVMSAIGVVIDIINDVVTALRGIIQFITGVFSGDWAKAWEGIKLTFSAVWEAIKTGVAPIINPILSAIESFINGIISGLNWLIRQINKISFDVPDWVPGIGGKKLGFNIKQVSEVSLPRLASGGYVAANTPQLAVIGDNKREGEIVAPESKIAEAVATGFAMVMSKMQQPTTHNDRPMYVTLKLGEDTFWEGFVDYHNSLVKRTGESPLLV